jgi:hypothetical protein
MTTMFFWIFYRFYHDYNLLLGLHNPFEGETEEYTREEVEALLRSDGTVATPPGQHRWEEQLGSTMPRRRNTAEMTGGDDEH